MERELLEWLWPGRVPLGKLTLLAGDPGLGKSFVTLDMAARVSRGAAWPDMPILKQTPAASCYSMPRTTWPTPSRRDWTRPKPTTGTSWPSRACPCSGSDGTSPFKGPAAAGRDAIDQNPDTRLVVIDPIAAYCGNVDSHKNSDVRGLLAPLAELASRHRLAIVAVTHLSKSGGTKAVYRAMGSLAFAAAARAVWAIVKDPDDPQRRLLLPAKLNLAQDPDGLAYRIQEGRVAWETEPVRMHADDAFAAELRAASSPGTRGTERREAASWLREELAEGSRPASEVIERGEQYGFTERTLQRALQTIGANGRRTHSTVRGCGR